MFKIFMSGPNGKKVKQSGMKHFITKIKTRNTGKKNPPYDCSMSEISFCILYANKKCISLPNQTIFKLKENSIF